jgi:WD40 repeat protein/serine/threonine protein kinase
LNTTASSGIDPVDDLIQAFLEQYRRGERPSLTEYTDKYPELAERIRDLFPALLVIEEVGSGVGQVNGFHEARTSLQDPMPQRLGDYRLLHRVGSGGMGIVYEAIQESLGRRVALKMLFSHHLGDATRLERFRREARAAARLHHTHIVPVYGIGEHNGLHFYTMQFIWGHGLDAVLQEVKRLRCVPSPPEAEAAPDGQISAVALAHGLRTGRLPTDNEESRETGPLAAGVSRLSPGGVQELTGTTSLLAESHDRSEPSDQSESHYIQSVARIGAHVATALEHAHQQGILHRDVKPANLLLDAQGQIWITDFGLAKEQGSDELTRTGDIVGTLKYMAPERFNGWSDPRSDVYALGATLYELLTLRPVFEESDRVKLVERVLHESPPPLRQIDRRIPRDLETIVLKAIAKEPGERYPTAGHFAEDLRRFVAGRPILARRSNALERSWSWSKRHPGFAAATGVVAASLVAVAVTAVLYANRQREFAAEQSRTSHRITDLAHRLERSLTESNRLLAIRNFDRGQAAFENDQIGPGLLWMIESWRSAVEARDPAWQHAARANLAAWQPYHARLKAVLSHDSPVDAAVFSPDGKTVLTGGDDGRAKLWDVATGQPIGQPMYHGGTVFAVAYSPDGRILLTGSADKKARRWDAATGQPIGSPISHEGEVRAVAYSPDGKTFLTGSADHMARLWDAATGQPICRPLPHSGSVIALAFGPDGKSFVTADYNSDTVQRWDAATGQPIGMPLRHDEFVRTVAFSPDGKTILTGSHDGIAWLWDGATGGLRRRLTHLHQSSIRALAFSPDGKTFLTGGTDKAAQLWDAATVLPISPPIRHEGPVVAVAFDPDGKTFLTASSDGTVRLWDGSPTHVRNPILEHRGAVTAIAFSPDGKTIITSSRDGMARQWNATTGQPIGVPLRHQDGVFSLAVSPDGKTILTGCGSPSNKPFHGTAHLWDTATGRPIGHPLVHHGPVTVVAFSPDGKTIMTGGQDKVIRLWDARTGVPISPPLEQPGAVDAGAFSPDGKTFLAAYDTGNAQLWDLASQTPLDRPFTHPGAVSAVAFSPDGKTLLTGCEDNMARLWDVASRTLRVPPLPSQGWIFCVAFSPDAKTVLTGSREDGAARLWDAATGMPLGPPLRQHPTGVTAVAFSPDGKTLVTGSYDAKARLFQTMPDLPDDLECVAAWVSVLTGLSLDAQQGSIRVLHNPAWLTMCERLKQLGGSPIQGHDRAATRCRGAHASGHRGCSRVPTIGTRL